MPVLKSLPIASSVVEAILKDFVVVPVIICVSAPSKNFSCPVVVSMAISPVVSTVGPVPFGISNEVAPPKSQMPNPVIV